MGKKRYTSWAEKNGFTTGYNNPVTHDYANQAERVHRASFKVHYCPECKRCFDVKGRNWRGRKLLKPSYLPGWYPSLDKTRSLCGGDKCVNKLKEK